MRFTNLQSSLFKTISGIFSVGILLNPLTVVQASNVTFVPPQGDRPQDSQGGASRDGGKCPQDDKSLKPYLTPVIPADAQSLTSQSRPAIFVYVPQTKANKAFLSLQDDKNQQHYQTFLPLEKKGGIVKISLPADAPPLTVNTDYKWSFVMLCGDKLLPDSPTVTGTIRRINLDQNWTNQLGKFGQKPSLEKAALLGKAGIWYDMLGIMVDLKAEQPNNFELNKIWSDMLRSVKLEAIATQPIIAQK